MKLNVSYMTDVCEAREHSGQVRHATTRELEATREARVTTDGYQ
jgi:hypothetical protein